MSNGRFLVSLKHINKSDKIVKIKYHFQEGFKNNNEVIVLQDHKEEATKIVNDFEEFLQRQSTTYA